MFLSKLIKPVKQWDTTAHAGFTTGTPWMRVNEDFKDGWNVADQEEDPNSVLHYWRRMIAVRKANPVLVSSSLRWPGSSLTLADAQVHGNFLLLDRANPCVFAYKRKWEGVKALVILSFAPGDRKSVV